MGDLLILGERFRSSVFEPFRFKIQFCNLEMVPTTIYRCLHQDKAKGAVSLLQTTTQVPVHGVLHIFCFKHSTERTGSMLSRRWFSKI